MKAIVRADNRVVDFSADDVIWTLEDGMREEHVDDSFVIAHDPWDYVWDGGPVYVEPAPEPYPPAEAIAILLRGSVTDAEAVRLKPYLPVFDATREYSEGDLAIRFDKAARRTSTGWREIG